MYLQREGVKHSCCVVTVYYSFVTRIIVAIRKEFSNNINVTLELLLIVYYQLAAKGEG